MVSIMDESYSIRAGADDHLKKLTKKVIGKYYYRPPKNKMVILKIKPE
jgi:hypothetical protein